MTEQEWAANGKPVDLGGNALDIEYPWTADKAFVTCVLCKCGMLIKIDDMDKPPAHRHCLEQRLAEMLNG